VRLLSTNLLDRCSTVLREVLAERSKRALRSTG
jgi:hypothetical protein